MVYKYSVTSLELMDYYEFELTVYSACEETELPEGFVLEKIYGCEQAFMYISERNDDKVNDKFLEYYKQHFIFGTSSCIYSLDPEKIYGGFNIPVDELGEIPLNSVVPIKLGDGVTKYLSDARNPYYRMRGKPVTEEQALDIIRRMEVFSRDYLPPTNFYMCWLIDNNIQPRYGWVHPDGTVGLNGITQKYPQFGEYMSEWTEYVDALPYLDLVIAVTSCNEIVPEGHSFEEYIDIGIWVHDRMVEFLAPETALEKYKEYCNLYEDPNEARYEPETCLESQNKPIDIEEYRERCVQACKAANSEYFSKNG